MFITYALSYTIKRARTASDQNRPNDWQLAIPELQAYGGCNPQFIRAEEFSLPLVDKTREHKPIQNKTAHQPKDKSTNHSPRCNYTILKSKQTASLPAVIEASFIANLK